MVDGIEAVIHETRTLEGDRRVEQMVHVRDYEAQENRWIVEPIRPAPAGAATDPPPVQASRRPPETPEQRAAWRAAMPTDRDVVSPIRRPLEFERALGAMAGSWAGAATVSNGIALGTLHHELFDAGTFTLAGEMLEPSRSKYSRPPRSTASVQRVAEVCSNDGQHPTAGCWRSRESERF